MTQFTAVEAAMAVRRQAFTEYMRTPEPPRNDRPARDAWREATERAEAAEAVVDAAYASELLPALLGGAWSAGGITITTFSIIPCTSGAMAPAGCSP